MSNEMPNCPTVIGCKCYADERELSKDAKIGILMRCYLPFLWTIGACTTGEPASRIVAIIGAVVSSMTLAGAIIRAIEETKP